MSTKTFLGLLTIASLFITSCRTNIKETKPETNIDSTLAQNPPLPNDIFIQELAEPNDSGNIKFAVSLPGVNGQLHAVMVGDEKLTLHDDGINGDEKAGDKIFSIIIKEDIDQFLKESEQKQNNIKGLQGKPMVKFVNRHAVTIPANKFSDVRIDRSSLRTGIRLPTDFFTPLPDPALRDHSLMITDLKVVRDKTRTFDPCTSVNPGNPNGAWTFNKLITDMANTAATGTSAENFVREWLDQWMNDQTINSDLIEKRTRIFQEVIEPWIMRTTPGAAPTQSDWKTFALDLAKAPFKLEAIVNRIDLRGNIGYSASNAGEGRFVFSVIDNVCRPLLFTVILEYGIPKSTCHSIKTFAQQWYALKNSTPGSTQYNDALQAITDQFAAAGANSGKPNGSALNQLRTNEIQLGSPWQLREFKISDSTHTLQSVAVANEPAEKYNRRASGSVADVTVLATYVNDNEDDIKAQRHSVPAIFNGVPFQGAKAHTKTPDHFWDGAALARLGDFITNDSARHFISLNTCSGCHGGEGKTEVGNLIQDPPSILHRPFLQIAPQNNGTKATLAAFLTGDPNDSEKKFRVIDPAGRPRRPPNVWTFNDLDRRAQDLEELVNNLCVRKLPSLIHIFRFKPLNMVH